MQPITKRLGAAVLVATVGLLLLAGCETPRLAKSGPVVWPSEAMGDEGAIQRPLPVLEHVRHGTSDNPHVHPVLELAEVKCPWIVGYTRSDSLWVSGHRVCITYKPSRFRPQAAGRVPVPVAPELEAPGETPQASTKPIAPQTSGAKAQRESAPRPQTTSSTPPVNLPSMTPSGQTTANPSEPLPPTAEDQAQSGVQTLQEVIKDFNRTYAPEDIEP